MQIINAHDYTLDFEAACRYIHSKWGNKDNYAFYYDAIVHAGTGKMSLPQFYLIIDGEEFVGCFALITNDFISRHDLFPWFACLFVEPQYRGKQLGSQMMQYGREEARRMGFSTIYLTTDHDGYYEKYGWERMEDGFEPNGNRTRIYRSKC